VIIRGEKRWQKNRKYLVGSAHHVHLGVFLLTHYAVSVADVGVNLLLMERGRSRLCQSISLRLQPETRKCLAGPARQSKLPSSLAFVLNVGSQPNSGPPTLHRSNTLTIVAFIAPGTQAAPPPLHGQVEGQVAGCKLFSPAPGVVGRPPHPEMININKNQKMTCLAFMSKPPAVLNVTFLT
jgi:hypothetical protein